MSTWIFDRIPVKPILLILCVAGLAACGGGRLGGGTSQARGQDQASGSVSKTLTVAGRQIVIQGPPGYCIDETATEAGYDTAFVMLGDCAVVAPGARAPRPDKRALLTASVSGATEGGAGVADSLISMDRFFRSETGRTALSRSSDPETVEILETFQSDGAFYLRASDTSQADVPGLGDEYWRVFFDVDDQIVSVSVVSFRDAPLGAEEGLETATQFTGAILTANGGDAPAIVEVAETEDVTETTTGTGFNRPRTQPTGGLSGVGLLRRLFGS
jgi:hypothetical protein